MFGTLVFTEPAPLIDTSFPDQSEPSQTDPNLSTTTSTTVTTKQRSNTETSYTAETSAQQNDLGTGGKSAPAGQAAVALVGRPRPVPKKANPGTFRIDQMGRDLCWL